MSHFGQILLAILNKLFEKSVLDKGSSGLKVLVTVINPKVRKRKAFDCSEDKNLGSSKRVFEGTCLCVCESFDNHKWPVFPQL